jgi:DNA-binding NarL/FixJ family response regulator
MQANSVLIAVADPRHRRHLVELLSATKEYHITGYAHTAPEVHHQLQKQQPAIVLMDVYTGTDCSAALCHHVKDCFPGTEVVVVTHCTTTWQVEKMLLAGTAAYKLLPLTSEKLLATLAKVQRGMMAHSSDIQPVINRIISGSHLHQQLTEKDVLVLRGIALQQTYSQLGAVLYMTPDSVKAYCHHLRTRLGLAKGYSLATFSLKHGLVQLWELPDGVDWKKIRAGGKRRIMY